MKHASAILIIALLAGCSGPTAKLPEGAAQPGAATPEKGAAIYPIKSGVTYSTLSLPIPEVRPDDGAPGISFSFDVSPDTWSTIYGIANDGEKARWIAQVSGIGPYAGSIAAAPERAGTSIFIFIIEADADGAIRIAPTPGSVENAVRVGAWDHHGPAEISYYEANGTHERSHGVEIARTLPSPGPGPLAQKTHIGTRHNATHGLSVSQGSVSTTLGGVAATRQELRWTRDGTEQARSGTTPAAGPLGFTGYRLLEAEESATEISWSITGAAASARVAFQHVTLPADAADGAVLEDAFNANWLDG